MKDARFVTMENIIPLVSPVDTTTTAVATPWVDMKNALHATFFAFFGSITSASTDQTPVVTMEVSTTAASSGEVAIAFNYRQSGVIGANTWGAITAATTAGVSVAVDTDDSIVAVDVNPAAFEAALASARFVRMVITPDAGASACEIAAWAVLDPRYPQLTHKSAT